MVADAAGGREGAVRGHNARGALPVVGGVPPRARTPPGLAVPFRACARQPTGAPPDPRIFAAVIHSPSKETLARIEVLQDMEPLVDELMQAHESKRVLWFPSEILAPAPDTDPDRHVKELRDRAEGISLPSRVAIALNTLTEEGLPHFHRLLATYLGGDTFWAKWNNLWTAEEDRHGAILHDYTRDSRLLDAPVFERMQFEYLRAGFEPAWDRDPYRVFVYTTLQERATQVSHANTGRIAGAEEPLIGEVLSNVAKEEARHYTFYRNIFKAVLERDPNRGLVSAAEVMPSIDMPGINMPHFREMADVIRRAGIYGPRDYLKIVEEQVRFWAIEAMTGLDEAGKRAQEKILAVPERLKRVADLMETRSRAKSFSFAVAFGKEFSMA
jgi:acyl-[acyl-carrier-protein] desaturase